METIAVYWEPIIKTYGFSVKTDLSLVKISFPSNWIATFGAKVGELDTNLTGGGFNMLVGHLFDGKRMQMNLLFENRGTDLIGRLNKLVNKEPAISLHVDTPVELIYFQGPHYGDRYGIADAAFSPFNENKISILASGCSSASIYIVVSENNSGTAVKFLSEKFAVPQFREEQ